MSLDSAFARRLAGLIALGLFAVSLALPAVTTSSASEGTWSGAAILAIGFLGVLLGQFGWFANLLMLWSIVWLCLARRVGSKSLAVAVIALLLALSAFTWTKAADDSGEFDIVSRGAGFYLWIACALWLAAAATFFFRQDRARAG